MRAINFYKIEMPRQLVTVRTNTQPPCKHFGLWLRAFLLLVATFFPYEISVAQDSLSDARAPLRIDAPLTNSNSVRVNLGGGVLRVPKYLLSTNDTPANSSMTVSLQILGFTFWYPDMTLTCFGNACGTRPAPSSAEQKVQSDQRFKVFVTNIEYSSDGMRSPRPSDIFNREVKNVGYPTITQSKFRNLRILDWSEAFKKKNPQYADYKPINPSSGNLYYQDEKSPYEIWMSCDSVQCKGNAYSKSHHFELSFILSRTNDEVISRTDEMLNALNKVIDHWSAK